MSQKTWIETELEKESGAILKADCLHQVDRIRGYEVTGFGALLADK